MSTPCRSLVAAHATPGAAVAVVRDRRVVHLAGYANPDETPVTLEEAFLIGSFNKPITAALLGPPAPTPGPQRPPRSDRQ